MKKQKKVPVILELEERTLASQINDKEFDRPAALRLMVMADAKTQYIFDAQMRSPQDQWPATYMAAAVAFILDNGIPREIRVPDEVAKGCLSDLCEELGIRLTRHDYLPAVERFFDGAPF